ncbi:MAG: nuclear transport factor 2 family protein [Nocardioides sp.]
MITSDSLTWVAPDDDNPARLASQWFAAAVAAGAKQDWLDLFAPDAVLEDPVGPSVLDPEGAGHRGREGLSHYWDLCIAGVQSFHFTVYDSFANGDCCANVATISSLYADGRIVETEGVFVYCVDAQGRITSMRGHWEYDRAMATTSVA